MKNQSKLPTAANGCQRLPTANGRLLAGCWQQQSSNHAGYSGFFNEPLAIGYKLLFWRYVLYQYLFFSISLVLVKKPMAVREKLYSPRIYWVSPANSLPTAANGCQQLIEKSSTAPVFTGFRLPTALFRPI